MSVDDQEKMRRKELGNNPMGNYSDAINCSMIGDPLALVRGGCLTKFTTVLIIIIGFAILSQCSS
ncbi:hypothetical protein FZW96_21185 [Bacillus sp. BGMRC 2118]|nr:hypothetical protein FZW96_21185 [Bacillus sp. BGMRC 2118]